MNLHLAPAAPWTPGNRRPVTRWYPVVQVLASDDDIRRAGLEIETAHDDLGDLSRAYAETAQTPLLMTRHAGEPEGLCTLHMDAERLAHAHRNMIAFAVEVLEALHMGANEVVWRNTDLERWFPAADHCRLSLVNGPHRSSTRQRPRFMVGQAIEPMLA